MRVTASEYNTAQYADAEIHVRSVMLIAATNVGRRIIKKNKRYPLGVIEHSSQITINTKSKPILRVTSLSLTFIESKVL